MAKIDFFSGKYAITGIEDALKRAAVSALNKFAARLVVMLRQKAMAKYNLKRSSIDKRISIDKASAGKYRVSILVEGVSISLMEFNPTRGATGVRVEIIKGKPIEIAGSFLGTRKVGRLGSVGNMEVFQRKGPARLPIRVTIGTRISDLLRSQDMQDAMKQKYRDEFGDLLKSEFKFFYSKVT